MPACLPLGDHPCRCLRVDLMRRRSNGTELQGECAQESKTMGSHQPRAPAVPLLLPQHLRARCGSRDSASGQGESPAGEQTRQDKQAALLAPSCSHSSQDLRAHFRSCAFGKQPGDELGEVTQPISSSSSSSSCQTRALP